MLLCYSNPGPTIKDVQKRLGHTNVNTIDGYLHSCNQVLKEKQLISCQIMLILKFGIQFGIQYFKKTCIPTVVLLISILTRNIFFRDESQ